MENELNALKTAVPGDMKAALLQAAMQGKLTTQRKEDGDARDLLKQIAKEKEQLIKEKKIKKEKPLPEITEDEIPFDVPENWVWVRLQEISTITGGYAFKSSNYSNDGIRVLRISDFNEKGILNKDIVRHQYIDDIAPFKLENKNIVMCMTGGTVGKNCYVDSLSEDTFTNQRVCTIKSNGLIDSRFVYFAINNVHVKKIVQESKNSTNDNISMNTIQSFMIPLPPLAEQHRIVAKLEKLLPLCDGLVEE